MPNKEPKSHMPTGDGNESPRTGLMEPADTNGEDRRGNNAPPADGKFFSHRVVGGVPWAVTSKAVLFFVYFGVSILTVRVLGAERYGIFSICKNIGEYLVVVCGLGLNTAVVRFVPELLVKRNRAGMTRFLGRALALQMAAVALAMGVMWAAKPAFDAWFSLDFGNLLIYTMLLVAAQVAKDFVNDTFTALFQMRVISILSIVQGVLWLGLLATILPAVPEVSVALLVQMVSVVAVCCTGFVLLRRFIHHLNWRSPLPGIGMQRTAGISVSSLVNSMANMLMRKYTEVFFLGAFFSPAIVGMYDLGYSITLMVISFIPLALQKLFTSGFSEAYAQDDRSLEKLIPFYYKVLILAVMPFAAFGTFFASHAVTLFYGPEMHTAGMVASIFFMVHTLNLIYVPISMGVVAKEKILQTVPLTVLQIIVKLLLDYLLIPRFEIWGAVAAVIGTFVLTLPIHLYVVYRILGGIYFPTMFLMKVTVPLIIIAALVSPLAPVVGIAGLCGLGVAYLSIYVFILKRFRLIKDEDVAELKGLGFSRLNRVLDFLSGTFKS